MLAAGESLLFSSATGTGKTFAYLLPLLGRLLEAAGQDAQNDGSPRLPRGECPRVFICAPTYELCSQIKNEADCLLASAGGAPSLKSCLLIGSVQTGRQVESLRTKPALIVGNPGRLLLLAHKGKLKFRDLECLVLDEGDRLVSDELIEETGSLIEMIRGAVPKGRGFQTVACSATIAPKERETLTRLMGGGVKILESGGMEVLRGKIEHWAVFSEERRKVDTLRSLIAAMGKGKNKGAFKALIFTARGNRAADIAALLQHHKLAAAGLWGGMEKKQRKAAIDGFRSGGIRFLVTSDLAARGLDINDVDYIITLDTGDNTGAYIHRAGRTARAGKHGVMISIGAEADLIRLSKLEKKLGIVVYPKEIYEGRVISCTLDNK